LEKAGLASEIKWKISCRVDDLEPDILESMINHGLMAVYLGVESGNDQGLLTLNKHVSVKQNFAAIDLLKSRNVAMAIGFMLFDPSSTVDSIRENIEFLRLVGEDGYFPVNFCKMLPYAGTPIESLLRDEGRLKGTVTQPNYDFIDPELDWYEFLVQQIFSRRNFGHDGNVALLQKADFDLRLTVAFGDDIVANDYGESLRRIISRSNNQAVETLGALLNEIVSHGMERLLQEQETIIDLANREWHNEMMIEIELQKLILSEFSGNNLC
jgi:hypothetical protein